ncbi:exported hypothetical protein [Rhodococcus sp. RD6.2]|nr:exported hypothetical protein [Rhodococcus sp. RD6.2]
MRSRTHASLGIWGWRGLAVGVVHGGAVPGSAVVPAIDLPPISARPPARTISRHGRSDPT